MLQDSENDLYNRRICLLAILDQFQLSSLKRQHNVNVRGKIGDYISKDVAGLPVSADLYSPH